MSVGLPEINLLPPERRRGAAGWGRAVITGMLAAVLILLALAAGWLSLAGYLEADRVQELEVRARVLAPTIARRAALLADINRLRAAVPPPTLAWGEVFRRTYAAVPGGVSLQSLSLSGRRAVFDGRAGDLNSLSDLAAKLDGAGWQDVRLESANRENGTYQFSVSASLGGGRS